MADITEENCFGFIDLFQRFRPFPFFFPCQ
jgi:hypothetical protein